MKDYTLKGYLRRQSEMSRYALNLEHRLSLYDTELTKAKKRIWELKDLLDYEKSISDQKQNEINLKYREVIALQEHIEELEAGKPKWHKTADGDLPPEDTDVLALLADKEIYMAHFYRRNVWDKIGPVIAWCEIPKYTEE